MFKLYTIRCLCSIVALTLSIAGSPASAQSSIGSSGMWSGLYGGLNIGYGSADIDWALNGNGWWNLPGGTGIGNTSFSPENVLAGIHLGYGQQTQNNFYYGVDASFSPSEMKGSKASLAFPTLDTWSVGITDIWDVSGRFGYTRNKFLIYAAAGIAGAKVKTRATPPVDTSNAIHVGYSLGVGGEYMFATNTSIGIEYKYYDFGSKNHSFNAACGPCRAGDGRKIDASAHAVKLRLTFHY